MNDNFTEENVDEINVGDAHPGVPQEEITEPTPEQKYLEANDKYLRLMAEFDNFKKRSLKEKEDLFAFVVCDCVAGFLPILDNLDRAISAGEEVVGRDALGAPSNENNNLLEGVKLIQKQFIDTLTTIGVEEIKTVGEEFNPELHNAVMHVEDDTVGANIIVEEFMKGYIYKGKVIRHSMVKSAN